MEPNQFIQLSGSAFSVRLHFLWGRGSSQPKAPKKVSAQVNPRGSPAASYGV